MGKFKQYMIEQEEVGLQTIEEAEANQEAYYYHCIAEFYGMLKVFGTKKVMADLAAFKDSVEPKKPEPLIILPK